LSVPQFRFAPASNSERYIFGSERPGYGSKNVSASEIEEWLFFMNGQGIQRVCCLLDGEQLGFYKSSPLLQAYETRYKSTNVLHTLIPDFELCEVDLLVNKIIPFLEDSTTQRNKTVVHCAGGKGRTGHVLAAWLVYAEEKSPADAISMVSSLHREPLEAVERGNASRDELDRLLLSVLS